MALGDSYNNNKDKKQRTIQLYSPVCFSNPEGFDPTYIGVTFWNKLMKIAISPRKGEEWDHDNAGAIHLTHLKAKQLADQIGLYLEDPDAYQNLGVPSGQGLISISNGIEFTGKKNPCIVIRKINQETGAVEGVYAYELKRGYHYSVRNYDEKTNDFDKVYDDLLELVVLQTTLLDYYHGMNGALAYSIQEFGKYDYSRLNTKINDIAEKMGISYGNGNSGGNVNKPKGSVFDKSAGRNYADVDDIG